MATSDTNASAILNGDPLGRCGVMGPDPSAESPARYARWRAHKHQGHNAQIASCRGGPMLPNGSKGTSPACTCRAKAQGRGTVDE
jgi:hypothetical protein